MTLGQKIKKLRTDKGCTQKDLADQFHVTFQTVSKWENDENEPDVATLRELSKFFNCSYDYLLGDSETPNATVAETKEEPTKTIIIHQKEMHVCERCKKDIPEDELTTQQICVHHARRGHSAEYRTAYYHKSCLSIITAEKAASEKRIRAMKTERAKKLSFTWGIIGGVVTLAIALLVLFLNEEFKSMFHPAASVGISIGAGYGIFAMLYCIISGSYIGDVFTWCISRSIKFPGLIFTWDFDGFMWLIWMKLLFAIIGFFFGLFMAVFGIVFSALLGGISFPFVLIHNNITDYDNAI